MALSPGSFRHTIQASNGFSIMAEYVPCRESSDLKRTAYALAAFRGLEVRDAAAPS